MPFKVYIKKGVCGFLRKMQHTSPHPLVEVTLLKARLMVPPPFPLWVDKEPDRIAVSFVVRGACSDKETTTGSLMGNVIVLQLFHSKTNAT